MRCPVRPSSLEVRFSPLGDLSHRLGQAVERANAAVAAIQAENVELRRRIAELERNLATSSSEPLWPRS
jgi:hypothetical protein